MANFAGNLYSLINESSQKLASPTPGPTAKGPRRGIKIKKRDLIFILRNVAILVENGLALPKAPETLFQEKSLKYAAMLRDIQHRVDSGEAFSDALAGYPQTFNELLVNQIRVGERSGTIPATISRLVSQLEHADNLKSKILRSHHPALLIVADRRSPSCCYVVPTFETVYKESGAKLPAVTQFLIDLSAFGTTYGWMICWGLRPPSGPSRPSATIRPAGCRWTHSCCVSPAGTVLQEPGRPAVHGGAGELDGRRVYGGRSPESECPGGGKPGNSPEHRTDARSRHARRTLQR